MNNEPLFTITRCGLDDNQTLRIYDGFDKIEDQIYYTFEFQDRRVVITQFDGRWMDLGGKNPDEAKELGLLLEQLQSIKSPKQNWVYLKPSDFKTQIGNDNGLIYDGVIGIYGVDKRITLSVNGTPLSFDLQRVINARNQALQKLPAMRMYEVLINYNLESKVFPLQIIVRSPQFRPVYDCYFDYVVAGNRQVYLVGVTFGEFQPGRYMSQLIALIQIPQLT